MIRVGRTVFPFFVFFPQGFNVNKEEILSKITMNINIYPRKTAKIFLKSGNMPWKEMSCQVSKRQMSQKSG